MLTTIEYYFLLFFSCSVFGWLMEVTCKLVQFHRFINRGFLIGPYCPIYGFGAVMMTFLLSDYVSSPVLVFFLAMAICGILEYATSFFMEKFFHARWWDYSSKKFNINGRVCANTLIPFGLLGLFIIYLANPVFFRIFSKIKQPWLHLLCAGLFIFMTADLIISASVLSKIKNTALHVHGDSTEVITHLVREKLKNVKLARRALRAFPYLQMYNKNLLERARTKRKALEKEMQEKHQALRKDLEIWEIHLREEKDKIRQHKSHGHED